MKRVMPAISKGIADNKDMMIDALYPIMGGMIAKYVTQAIKEMTETINAKIEDGLSFERYKRKAKARLSGVSETELLMEESSDATVSSLFVIQKKSSLLVAEAHLEDKEIDDAHMVASMASAIRDFINDWVQNNDTEGEVQILSYGNATLYIESAGSVFLVAFLDAEPDYEQRKKINAFFASVIKKYSAFFQTFDGDDSAEEVLELSTKMREYLYAQAPSKRPKSKKNPAKYIFMLLGALLFGYGVYLFDTWYAVRSLEHKIKVQTGESISLEKEDDTLVLNGQIHSFENADKIHTLLKREDKNIKIDDHLTVPVSYMDKRFKMLSHAGTEDMSKRLKALESRFAASVDMLDKKVLRVQRNNKLLQEKLKEKNDEISALKRVKQSGITTDD